MNVRDYIESGILELYVAGSLSIEEIREGAAWLIRDLQALIERIDRDAIDAVVLSTGITGSLATRIDLGGAELAALKTRLKTLEMLKG